MKLQASSYLLWLYSPVCVRPGRKSRRPVFPQRGSVIFYSFAAGPLDPVYSLLKCAADLPKGGSSSGGGKSPCLIHAHCSGTHQTPSYNRYPSGGDSSGSTSKTSSPSSSGKGRVISLFTVILGRLFEINDVVS